MPYLVLINPNNGELDVPRYDLSETTFKMSPPRKAGDAYTLINLSPIRFRPTQVGGIPAQMGVTQEVDDAPFVVIPLGHTRPMQPGDGLVIGPGQLIIDMWSLRPAKEHPSEFTKQVIETVLSDAAVPALNAIWELCIQAGTRGLTPREVIQVKALCSPFVKKSEEGAKHG